MVTFGQAIASGFKNYVVWKGRATRAEFWWWYLFYFLVTLPFNIWYQVSVQATISDITNAGGTTEQYVAALNAALFGPAYFVLVIVALALFLPTLAMVIRRLHDQNKSGGYWWMVLIPLAGPIILFVFMLLPSNPEGSRFDAK